MGDYRDLVFYQKAGQVVRGVNALIKNWPRIMQAQGISRQLFRSSTSIGTNIAEGHGRHEGAEYIHYLIIAQGSANETDHWLQTARDINLGTQETIRALIDLNNEVRRMLTASINTLNARRANKSMRDEPASYIIETQSTNE